MSARTPVAIVYLPNQPFLIGTFDTTNFQNWWRSKPFPDEIQFIKKGFHIFGRTHLAIAKRADGRWAIYRSKNYGIDWERVFLAAEGEVIYDAIIIKFGWAIVNTSTGFYETVKAGADGSWTKVSDLPGATVAPAFCNVGMGDVLLCTDGRYIWRSTDKARNWALVCDQAAIGYRGWYKVIDSWEKNGFAWTYGSPLTPTIAGANGEVICAYGPWITISSDAGVNWTNGWIDRWGIVWKNCWDGFFQAFEALSESGGPVFPPRSLIYDRFPGSATSPPTFVIKQILVSSVSGPRIEDVSYVIRVDDLIPIPGETNLFSGVFFAHHGQYFHPTHNTWADDNGPTFHPKFQQFLSPDENLNQLSAYETAIVGEEGMSRIVVSAQTTTDANGNPVPSLKYSINGGRDWTTLTVSNLKVADENGLPLSGGSFLDDSYVKSVWVSSACDNYGSWSNSEEGKRTQCQSYEMDVEIEGGKILQEDYNVDAIVVKIGEKADSVDALVAKDKTKPYGVDGSIEGPNTKTYRIDRGIEAEVERTERIDVLVAKDKEVEDSLDAILEKNQRLLYRVSVGLHDQNSKSYLVGAKIVKSGLIKRLSRIERLSPQMLDLYLPYVPYNPYDSAWEYV